MTAEGWGETVWKFDLSPCLTCFLPGLGAKYLFCSIVIYIDLAHVLSGRLLS